MEVDDMFGRGPEEEVVEEEVPVSVIPAAVDSSILMSSHSFSGSSSPMSTTVAPASSFGSFSYQVDEDTSAYKTWKATHEAELDDRSKAEQKARQEVRAAGKAELDKILAEHRAKVEKTKATNRQHQAEHGDGEEASVKGGASWDRVASYMGAKVERDGARDTSRYREVVLKMKHA